MLLNLKMFKIGQGGHIGCKETDMPMRRFWCIYVDRTQRGDSHEGLDVVAKRAIPPTGNQEMGLFGYAK